ncbi:putative eukaryotic translation initiation factor 2B [Paratrimastix pyriformis]|uniref:Translation initiation factor eIF2B subunit gamma n=1 Tax=Paratrimastix pyriformis TaxID=342808 RepID=A0ABQ8ULD3_9EUKA|nr:putative eukaryotic translation initiation factor 2B [Paratrimastix pyriformis]
METLGKDTVKGDRRITSDFVVVILSQGIGPRLPNVPDLPKGLLPICGSPILVHQLEMVERAGLMETIVVAEKSSSALIKKQVEQYRSTSRMHVSVVASNERDTAAILRQLRPKIPCDLIVISGDVVASVLLDVLADTHRAMDSSLTVVLKKPAPGQEPSKQPTLLVGHDQATNRLLHWAPLVSKATNVTLRRSVLTRPAPCPHTTIRPHFRPKYPNMTLASYYEDPHIYVLARWVVDLLAAPEGADLHTLQDDLIPYLVKGQHAEAQRAHFMKLMSEHGRQPFLAEPALASPAPLDPAAPSPAESPSRPLLPAGGPAAPGSPAAAQSPAAAAAAAPFPTTAALAKAGVQPVPLHREGPQPGQSVGLGSGGACCWWGLALGDGCDQNENEQPMGGVRRPDLGGKSTISSPRPDFDWTLPTSPTSTAPAVSHGFVLDGGVLVVPAGGSLGAIVEPISSGRWLALSVLCFVVSEGFSASSEAPVRQAAAPRPDRIKMYAFLCEGFCERVTTAPSFFALNKEAPGRGIDPLSACLPLVFSCPVPQLAKRPAMLPTARPTAYPSQTDSWVGEESPLPAVISLKRTVVGRGCSLGPNCTLKDSILMDAVRVGQGSRIDGCVVCEGATIEPGCTLTGCTVATGARVPPSTLPNRMDVLGVGAQRRVPIKSLPRPLS